MKIKAIIASVLAIAGIGLSGCASDRTYVGGGTYGVVAQYQNPCRDVLVGGVEWFYVDCQDVNGRGGQINDYCPSRFVNGRAIQPRSCIGRYNPNLGFGNGGWVTNPWRNNNRNWGGGNWNNNRNGFGGNWGGNNWNNRNNRNDRDQVRQLRRENERLERQNDRLRDKVRNGRQDKPADRPNRPNRSNRPERPN